MSDDAALAHPLRVPWRMKKVQSGDARKVTIVVSRKEVRQLTTAHLSEVQGGMMASRFQSHWPQPT